MKIKLNELRGIVKEIINESWKWKPSVSQKKAFAERMKDPLEKDAYEKRKQDKVEKRRADSKFDYNTAGGYYMPTKIQHDFAFNHPELFKTMDEKIAANEVMNGYSLKEKVHHDNIHIVNEKLRNYEVNKNK